MSKQYLVCTTAVLKPVSPLPDLCLYKCKEFSVHGTISSVVFQNVIITAVLETHPPPPDFRLYKCIEFEFRVSSKLLTGMIMRNKNICTPHRINLKNAGLVNIRD